MVTNRKGVNTGNETALSFVRQWIGETVSRERSAVSLLQTQPPAAQQPENKDTQLTECYINSYVWVIVFPQFQCQENGHVIYLWFTFRTDYDKKQKQKKNRGIWCLKLGCAKSAALCRLIKCGFFYLTTILCSEAVTCTRQRSFYSPLLLNYSTQPPTTLTHSQSKHHTGLPFQTTLTYPTNVTCSTHRSAPAQISPFTTDNSLDTCTAWGVWWDGVSAV